MTIFNNRLGLQLHEPNNPAGGAPANDPAPANQNSDDNGTQTHDDPAPSKNVDQNELRTKLQEFDEMKATLDKLLSTNPSGSEDKGKPAESEELAGIKAKLAERDRADQINLVEATANKLSADFSSVQDLLVGQDTQTTQANLQAFTSFLEEHDKALKQSLVQSTDTGFQTAQSDRLGNSKDFLNDLLDQQFGKK